MLPGSVHDQWGHWDQEACDSKQQGNSVVHAVVYKYKLVRWLERDQAKSCCQDLCTAVGAGEPVQESQYTCIATVVVPEPQVL